MISIAEWFRGKNEIVIEAAYSEILIRRNAELGFAERKVEARCIAAIQADANGFIERFLKSSGGVISADLIRELFPDFVADRTRWSLATKQPALAVAYTAFWTAFCQLTEPASILLMSGGAASRKTTLLETLRGAERFGAPFDLIVDSTLTSLRTASQRISAAVETGHRVTIAHAYLPYADQVRGIVERAQTSGRVVSLADSITMYMGSIDTLFKVAAEFGDRISIYVFPMAAIDRSLTPADALPEITLEDLRRLHGQEGDGERLRETAHTVLNHDYPTLRKSDPAIYQAFYGVRKHGRRP